MKRDQPTAISLKDTDLLRNANYIDGEWTAADDGAVMEVRSPSSGAPLGTVPAMGIAETRKAIAAAERAFPKWRALVARERGAILRRISDLMLENADDLGAIMTAEQGKPLAEAKGEIAYAAGFLEWFAEEGRRVYGETIPPHVSGRRVMVTREPIGVFAAITPWNDLSVSHRG